MALLTSPMALVTLIPRGQASEQLNDGPALENARLLAEDVEALFAGLVAAVENEPVGLNDGRRAHVGAVAPVDRTRGRAGRAHDALGGVVVAVALFLALVTLFVARVAGVDQVGQHRAVLSPERLHVDDEVFDHRQATNGLEGDLGAGVAHQLLAGQAVGAVDDHGIGATHAVRA